MKTLFVAVLSGALALSGLAEDPYIASDGTQAINTGYYVNAKTKIVIDFQLTEAGSQVRPFGQNGGGNFAQLYLGDTANNFKFGYGNDPFVGVYLAPNSLRRNTIVYDGPQNVGCLIQNGVTNATVQLTAKHDGTTVFPLAIFANSYNTDANAFQNWTKMKLYGFQIYEDDALVHNYIPAKRNGLFGLYDTETKVFLKDNRQGTNAKLFAGSDNVPDVGDAAYIENVTGQMINSRHYKTPNTRFEIDFALTAKPESQSDGGNQWRIAGQDSSDKPLSFYTGGSVKDERTFSFGQGDSFSAKACYKLDLLRHQMITDLHHKKLYFTTGEFGAATTNWVLDISDQVNTVVATRPLALMGYMANNNGVKLTSTDMKSSARAKYYRCRIFESDVLVHDYVPCVKGGEPGFKDLVDGAFVTCEDKTAITGIRAGGDVEQIPDDGYIEATGINQRIDTGYKATSSTRIIADFALTTNATNNAYDDLPAISQPWIYGHLDDAISFGSYVSGGAMYAWLCSTNGAKNVFYGTGVSATYRRRQMIVDADAGRLSFLTAGFTNEWHDIDKIGGAVTNQAAIMLFTRRNTTSAESLYPFAKLYGFQIYEAGELVRDFKPYIKNNVVGLRDELHPDTFVTTANYPLRCGGNIAGSSQKGAYIQSDGTQAISTGYKPNEKTKIEVTFAFDEITGQDRIFSEAKSMGAELYVQGTAKGSGNVAFIYGSDNTVIGAITTANHTRRTAVLDLAGLEYSISGGSSGTLVSSKIAGKTAGYPLGLFAKCDSADGKTLNKNSNSGKYACAKIYSLKISEDGKALHHYLPYKDGDTVCFMDVADGGKLVPCTVSGANPFKIGGYGWNENGDIFYTQPQGGMTISIGEATTLSAYAPGAVEYQWYKNGVALAGETGMTLTVPWQRKPHAATYTVKAKFVDNDVPVEFESDPATVNFNPSGAVLFIR